MRLPAKRTVFVGVAHTTEHPSFQATLEWVDRNVRPGMRVGVEGLHEDDPFLHDKWAEAQHGGKLILPARFRSNGSPVTVVSYETGLYTPREMFEFADAVRQRIESRGAQAVPIEGLSPMGRSARLSMLVNQYADELHEKLGEIEQKDLMHRLSPVGFKRGLLVPNRGILLPSGEMRLPKDDQAELDDLRQQAEKLQQKVQQALRRLYVTDAVRSKGMLRRSLGLDASIMGGAHAEDIQDYGRHIRGRRVVFLGFDNPRPVMGGFKAAYKIGVETRTLRRLQESFRQVNNRI